MNLIKSFKRIISIALSVLMITATMAVGVITVNAASETFVSGQTLYVNIGSQWQETYEANVSVTYVRFSYNNNDNDIYNNCISRVKLDSSNQVDGSIYEVTVPNNNFVRCIVLERCNPASPDTTATNKAWNTVAGLAVNRSSDSNNMFEISSWDTVVGWSTYTPVTPTEPTTATPTTPVGGSNWYVTARFGIKNSDGTYTYTDSEGGTGWNTTSTNLKMTAVSDTLYELETGLTLKELSSKSPDWFFKFYNGTTVYEASVDTPLFASDAGTSYQTTTSSNQSYYFNDEADSSTETVKLYLDTSSATPTFRFSVGGSTPGGVMSAGETVYVKSSSELSSITVSTTLDGAVSEPAVAMSKAGDVNAEYFYKYTLTADADTFNFTATDKATGETKNYNDIVSSTGKNMYVLSSSSWSNYEIDKATAFSSGLWIDAQPSVVNSPIALIKWSNQYGANDTSETYKLYIPAGVDMNAVPVYSKFSTLQINGTTVANGGTYSFTSGQTYTVNGDGTNYSLAVYQSTSPAIYTYTSTVLPTTIGTTAKTAYKNGGFMTANEDGTINDSLTTLAQIKGRGNSSWEASGERFGKYAYNIKLNSKIDPLDMGGTKAKSFCLLANNMDEAQLRNMVAFQMAEVANLPFTPNFKSVDLYNDGNYLGSYLITEKVDVGGSKLVDGDTVEDYHNDASATGNLSTATYSYNGGNYAYQYVDTGVIDSGVDYTQKSYLLEFDLMERAQAENSWFVTPKGQYIALKAPEDLNQQEMLFIINKWCDAENAVYNQGYDAAAQLMDMQSFADVYLTQEFSKNLDSGATSYYLYYDGTKGADVKWQATPIWDYDWSYGAYAAGNKKPINTSGSDATQDLVSTSGWFAKYKYITTTGEDNPSSTYNLQAQLSTMTDFWENDVKYCWNTDFYQSALDVFGTKNTNDGTIYEFFNTNKASYNMNETRYGFVASNPIADWGSSDTGSTPTEAYTFLKNWGADRAAWMNSKLSANVSTIYVDPSEFGNPENLYAYVKDASGNYVLGDGTNMYKMEKVTDENDAHYGFFIAKIVTSDSTYEFGASTTQMTNSAFNGTKATNISTDSDYHFSSLGTVTPVTSGCVHAPYAELNVSSEAVSANTEVTVTADVVRALSYTVTVQLNGSDTPIDITSDMKFTPDTDGVYVVTLTAQNNSGTTTLTKEVTVGTVEPTTEPTTVAPTTEPTTAPTEPDTTIPSGQVLENVIIKFKGTTLKDYVPTMTFNGVKFTMNRTDYIGTHYTGAYSFYYYEAVIPEVTVGTVYTINFQGAGNSHMNATATVDFKNCPADKIIYYAVNNMQSGTQLVDITNNLTARQCYRSPINMISNIESWFDPTVARIVVPKTDAEGVQSYLVGDIDQSSSINIKDATVMQMLAANLTEADDNKNALGDYDINGEVNIMDATRIQMKIANI